MVRGCNPIFINGVIASTIGGFCPGSHDFKWPTHELWGTTAVVGILRQHPGWPDIRYGAADRFLAALKNEDFAAQYLKPRPKDVTALLLRHGCDLRTAGCRVKKKKEKVGATDVVG